MNNGQRCTTLIGKSRNPRLLKGLKAAMITLRIAFVLVLFFTCSWGVCGEYNQKLSIGDAAPQWENLPGVDGLQHSFSDWKEQQLLVVVFTCNSCPYAVDAEDRLIALQKDYSSKGVALVAINVNKIEEDSLLAMKDRAAEKGFNFPYLFDETQQIAKSYGAMATPECFLIDLSRKVRYMGAIDDSPDGKNVSEKYLELAIDAVLKGNSPEVAETVPIGCRVRYERERRKRSRSASSEN